MSCKISCLWLTVLQMRWLAWRQSFAITIALACLIDAVLAEPASAHIKWFCAYNVAAQPNGLGNVLCPNFEYLIGLSVLALLTGSVLESTPIGAALLRGLDHLTRVVRDNFEFILRAACAFFFIAIWAVGGILLTPELKNNSGLVGAIQLGIAAGMVSRRTMPLSALGIVVLYAIAIWQYGVFHLADYPVFFGIAAYLALTGIQSNFLAARPIDVLRWAAGTTLMWASIEKWAYPEWTFPLFIYYPAMEINVAPDVYMRSAGAIEFALAFALMWTPLVRRVAAAMLAVMFVSAVLPFGKIDLIGHTLIVVAFVGIVADNGGKAARWRDSWLLPPCYAAALVMFLATYYVGHAALFGTTIL
jgi:hypothetical protein